MTASTTHPEPGNEGGDPRVTKFRELLAEGKLIHASHRVVSPWTEVLNRGEVVPEGFERTWRHEEEHEYDEGALKRWATSTAAFLDRNLRPGSLYQSLVKGLQRVYGDPHVVTDLLSRLEALEGDLDHELNPSTRAPDEASHSEPSAIERELPAGDMVHSSEPFVFISYSHTDVEVAESFAAQLKTAGVEHFRDLDVIEWGEDIPERVHEALRRATHLAVLISPGSEKSAWVAYEMGFARGRSIKVVPYLLHPSMNVRGFISHLRHLKTKADVTNFVQKLKERHRSTRAVPLNMEAGTGKRVEPVASVATLSLEPFSGVGYEYQAALSYPWRNKQKDCDLGTVQAMMVTVANRSGGQVTVRDFHLRLDDSDRVLTKYFSALKVNVFGGMHLPLDGIGETRNPRNLCLEPGQAVDVLLRFQDDVVMPSDAEGTPVTLIANVVGQPVAQCSTILNRWVRKVTPR